MQIVTQEFLNLGIDEQDEINESQLIVLDIKDEDKNKFRTLALGKELSDSRAELFVLLKDVNDKEIQDNIIKNYKALQKFRKEDSKPVKVEKINTKITLTQGDVTIYCDGGCTPNPGKSGSGVAVYRAGELSELWYGLYEPMGTNNTAELGALYESLLIAKRELELGRNVEVKCDSMYSINCIKVWAISWEKKAWTKKGGEIKNLDIIKTAYYLYNELKDNMTLSHIKAHSGFEGNELADRMAVFTINSKNKNYQEYSYESTNAVLKLSSY